MKKAVCTLACIILLHVSLGAFGIGPDETGLKTGGDLRVPACRTDLRRLENGARRGPGSGVRRRSGLSELRPEVFLFDRNHHLRFEERVKGLAIFNSPLTFACEVVVLGYLSEKESRTLWRTQ